MIIYYIYCYITFMNNKKHGLTKDLSGLRFGKLLVLSLSDHVIAPSGKKRVAFNCLCDCGKNIVITSVKLSHHKVKSCGCCTHGLLNDLTGQKFGKLLVLCVSNDRVFDKNGKSWPSYNCICDCGNTVIVKSRSLYAKERRSCGCMTSTKYDRAFESTARRIYNREYADGDLLFEDFLIISQMNCFYCGVGPMQNQNVYRSKINDRNYSDEFLQRTTFVYNGLDRVDNSMVHNLSNCVACCKNCNFAKRAMSLEEFKNWVCRVYNNFGSK